MRSDRTAQPFPAVVARNFPIANRWGRLYPI